MALYFITGNKKKVEEARKYVEFEQFDIDQDEIQELDQNKINEHKLREAEKQRQGEFFCEDTALYIEALNGLPGPLIKWFIQSMGSEGLARLVLNYKNNNAYARTIVGYSNGKDIKFFDGIVKGKIVLPRINGYGWDPIFQPEGYNQTFAELGLDKKNKISMRAKAFQKFKDFLS